MRAYVRLLAPGGQTAVLGPGDLIGRLASAALQLDDGRISEAHAMVSLRGRELRLLGLRGLFAVSGQPTDDAVLKPGMIFQPAPGLDVLVEEVVLPEEVLALEGDGLPRQLLLGAVSLCTRPQVALLPRHRSDADAVFWDTGEGWRVRVGNDPPKNLMPGDKLHVNGREFRAVTVPLSSAGKPPTRLDGAHSPPLRIVTHFDTVHIHVEGGSVVALDGIAARILSELAALGGPAEWSVIAGEIWPEEEDRIYLRRRWDVSLARLRRKLRESRVRPDLIRAGGTGQVELLLRTGDRVECLG